MFITCVVPVNAFENYKDNIEVPITSQTKTTDRVVQLRNGENETVDIITPVTEERQFISNSND